MTDTGDQKIQFTGSAGDYFGIWIINLILSIITLGIYSAWAKVRRETFFKNNTKIAEDVFAYHATGGQILKGRLIAFAVIVIFQIVSTISPLVSGVLSIAIMFLLPWVLNVSMRFRARMTSYRNIRFNWHGTYWKTLWFFVIAPIFGLASLGLLLPLITKSYYSYFAQSHSYGTTRFSGEARVREYYYAFLIGAIVPVVLVILALTGAAILGSNEDSKLVANILPAIIAVLVYLILIIYGVLCRNLMVNNLSLGDVVGFKSTLDPKIYIWIFVSNLLAILVSIGLLIPWSMVRMYKYLCESTIVRIEGDIEKFVDDAVTKQSSFGEAVADFEGIEVGI